jgi:hypothetical protein
VHRPESGKNVVGASCRAARGSQIASGTARPTNYLSRGQALDPEFSPALLRLPKIILYLLV